MANQKTLNDVRNFLSKGRIQEAINLLKTHVNDEDIKIQLLQLESRLNNLRRKENLGTIEHNDARLEENRISNSLFLIVNNISTDGHIPHPHFTGDSHPVISYRLWIAIVAGILVVSLLIWAGVGGSHEETPKILPDACANVTCLHNGWCVDGKCECPPGYYGRHCELKSEIPDPCANINCENGGQCVDGTCKCPEGYKGSRCQTKIAVTLDGQWKNSDSNTRSIPIFIISNNGTKIRVYGKCSPTNCDWGWETLQKNSINLLGRRTEYWEATYNDVVAKRTLRLFKSGNELKLSLTNDYHSANRETIKETLFFTK
ncbi:MAG: hypothetical protein R2795_20655 [Saprospiraceae bacterium]